MRIKISRDWLEKNVFNHHSEVRPIIEDHDYIGIYQYDVNIKGNGKYGVRVGFFDNRLYRNKFFVTPTEGNYQIVEEVRK